MSLVCLLLTKDIPKTLDTFRHLFFPIGKFIIDYKIDDNCTLEVRAED